MSSSSNPQGFPAELAKSLTALRLTGDYNGAFARIDRELSAVFIDMNLPEKPQDLVVLNLLANRKASLLREVAGAELVDADGNRSGWAIEAAQADNVVAQITGYYQLALAASSRMLATVTPQEMSVFRDCLAAELGSMRREFLGWDDVLGPGGLPLPALPVPLGQILFSQLWSIGDFAGAEDLLFQVRDLVVAAGLPGGETGTREVAKEFYSYLLGLTDAQLEAGGLPRSEIAAAMREFALEG